MKLAAAKVVDYVIIRKGHKGKCLGLSVSAHGADRNTDHSMLRAKVLVGKVSS